MKNIFSEFVFEIVGAFITWAIKGFKGKLSDEMSSPYEANRKSIRNMIISGIFFLLIAVIVLKYNENKDKENNQMIYEFTIKK